MEYNTSRNKLEIKEYGRNIQKMIDIATDIKDDEKRQRVAHFIVELMSYMNISNKNLEEFKNKLWGHMFVISNFKLNVKSPYPIPTPETIRQKPERLKYPNRNPKFMHLGKNLEFLMNKAIAEQDAFKKQYLIQIIMNCIKHAYNTWHKEHPLEEAMKNELRILSNDKLIYEQNSMVKQILRNDRNLYPSNNIVNGNNHKNKNHKKNNLQTIGDQNNDNKRFKKFKNKGKFAKNKIK